VENVGIFYNHLEYFTAIWYNLWPFGIVCAHFEYFSQFGMIGPKKSGNTDFHPTNRMNTQT
jgi:hypothetical protein